ncbi:MAG TPA: ABC transporter ATP-binding protein [Azospirillaceae bacterium]|nr:ABC transporter ATP-binding protein [Azospirillaceae bacterium]
MSDSEYRPVLELRRLSVTFPGSTPVRALQDFSLTLVPGRALALVGESGSGKSTAAKVLTRLVQPDEGHIVLSGRDVTRLRGRAERLDYCRRVQMVFQDPFAALNPAHIVAHHLERPLALHRPDLDRAGREAAAAALLRQVELDAAATLRKYPHELSGGQRQRVNLARALAVEPQVVIADEPTSMLDVSIRLSVLDTLNRLKRDRGIALLYITHDIATARHVAEETAVIYRGRIVESGPTGTVLSRPHHPYTRLLLDAVPRIGRSFESGGRIAGEAARVRALSAGPGELVRVGPDHWVRETAGAVAA